MIADSRLLIYSSDLLSWGGDFDVEIKGMASELTEWRRLGRDVMRKTAPYEMSQLDYAVYVIENEGLLTDEFENFSKKFKQLLTQSEKE